ncbi:tetratricopeptide repeat protein [Flavivirga aquimarina]|uniref:Tetratricopeptide repeat protein n=1 Tax=Flavivirga aquimarina TaxID=2027862 RepID=A0ABT8W5H0_9FLAO|nr:tetratricopeptide repeat protein [Flavivirga aquimarina]MDO5968356.1 tetratricopeptide repeat protein [Flavivirga aquimarina]
MKNKYILLLLFIFPLIGNAQLYTKKQIDSILQEEVSLIRDGKLEDALLLNIDLAEQSAKINYDNGVSIAYIRIANILCMIGRHLESLKYLNLADKKVSVKNDPLLKIRIYSIYGRNYSALKIIKKSIDYFNKGIDLCKKTSPINNRLLSNMYSNKASAFLSTDNKLDSTLIYLHKAIKTKESPFRYAVLANYYLKVKINNDSATSYLNKCKELMQRYDVTEYHKSIILQAQANLYKSTGNYNAAIDYYQQSLDISHQIKKYLEIRLSYKLMSETYELLREEKKSHEYLVKYTQFSDSINNLYKKDLDIIINNFLKEQEDTHQKTENRMSFLFGVSILLSIVIIIVITYYYRKKRLSLITEKEKVIKQKEIESDELKQKINEAFTELTSLAKNNDPSFLVRFQEIYPNVCEELLKINPKLVNTELSLCAMIWLNFSSKDIATYTFVQPKTVQTKKYRLRKKLKIPSDKNIYSWLKGL